jgi:co-chaperonin GroES (HSP10)
MSKEKKEEKTAKPVRVVARPTRKSFEGKRKRRTAMPMKERPIERRSSTVKGIIASINDQAKTNDAAIAAFNANVREQMNENTETTVAFSTNVAALYETILGHARKQEEAIAAFNANVREQMNENTEYVKNFYG